MTGGRLSRGWALTKQSYAVLRADRSLAIFPVISVVTGLLAAAILFAPGFVLYSAGGHQEAFLIVFGVLAAYSLTFVSIFFNVALASCAAQALSGRPTTVGEGIAAARARIGAVAAWALVQTTVGLILQVIQSALNDNILGQIFSRLLAFAWGAATFFVVPILALEGAGPREAFKRSVSVLRERWGEGVVGTAAVGGIMILIGMIPAAILAALGVAVVGSAPAPGIALFVLAGLIFVAAAIAGTTLSSIFRVALYQFAVNGTATGGFEPAQLQAAFAPKKGRRRRLG